MQIAQIVPLVRLPSHLGFFDYEIPQDLEGVTVGSIVIISFRNREMRGVVIGLSRDTEEQSLKPVLRFSGEESVDAIRLSFFRWVSSHYVVSLSSVFSMALPRPPKRIIALPSRSTRPLSLHINPERISTLSLAYSLLQDTSRALLTYSAASERLMLYVKLAEDALSSSGQLLIVCPTIADIELLHSVLRGYFSQTITVLHGSLSRTALMQAHRAISSGESHVIIGTRTALFAPFTSLSCAVVDQSERKEHKQYDAHPRVHSIDLARTLCDLHNSRLVLSSVAPRLEEVHAVSDGSLSQISVQEDLTHTCINLADAFKTGTTTSFVTDHLLDRIRETLSSGKWVYLFLNRKGLSRMVQCRECSHVFHCESCQAPLRYTQSERLLSCERCAFSGPLTDTCPQCSSVRFSYPGLGIEKVAQTLNEILDVPVVSVSSGRTVQLGQSPCVVVGTAHVMNEHPEWVMGAGLVGVLVADPITSLSDFRSHEDQWQTLAHLFSLTSPGSLLLQAFDPTHLFMRSLCTSSYSSFSSRELSSRKSFFLPPYCRQIAFLSPYKTSAEADMSEFDDVFTRLSAACSDLDKSENYRIMKVFDTPRARQKCYILLSLSDSFFEDGEVQSSLQAILESLPKGWLVDHVPYSV